MMKNMINIFYNVNDYILKVSSLLILLRLDLN